MSLTSSPTPAEAPASSTSGALDKGVLKIAGVVVIGAIMSILDVTVVSIALPTFQDVFHTQYSVVAWTMTGYTLALATVIPLTGWAADRFGTKRLYLLALTLFVAGSVLCATAGSIGMLIFFRVLQGLGGGMLMPLGMTIVTHAAGPQRVGRVMALLGVPMLLGPIGGPILGGWLIDIASWHWIFLINLPIGIGALISAIRVLPADKPEPSESFDFLGMLLLSPGLALFLFGVSSVPQTRTLASARVIVPAVIGIGLMAAFVWHAMRTRHPLIDLRLFRHRQLTISVITMSFFAIAFFGAMLLFPTYFIQVRLETTLSAGLLLAPQGLGAMITMPIAGRLTDKYGPGWFALGGLGLIAIGMSVFTQITDTTSMPLILGSLFVMGLGMGSTMMPVMSAALASLSHHEVARGSTLMNIVQQSAGSIGTALMSVILTNQFLSKPGAAMWQAALRDPTLMEQFTPESKAEALRQSADAFGFTFTVALVLMILCVIPATRLARKAPDRNPEDVTNAPVLTH